MNKINRRNFIKKTSLSGAAIATASALSGSSLKERDSKSQYMGDFAAPKLENVKVAFIGVGARGSGHAKQIAAIEGTEVVGISDLYKDLAEKSSYICQEIGNGKRHKNIAIYSGNKNKWLAMLEEVKPDAVFISTNWDNHAPMAIETMKVELTRLLRYPWLLLLKTYGT